MRISVIQSDAPPYDRYGHEGLRSGGYAPNFDGFGSIGDLLTRSFPAQARSALSGGPAAGGDLAVAIDVELLEAAQGTTVSVSYEAVDRCEHCHGNGAEPGTPDRKLANAVAGPDICRRRLVPAFGRCCAQWNVMCATAMGGCQRNLVLAVVVVAARPGNGRWRYRSRRVSPTAAHTPLRPGHAGEAGAPPGDLYVLVRVREDAALLA